MKNQKEKWFHAKIMQKEMLRNDNETGKEHIETWKSKMLRKQTTYLKKEINQVNTAMKKKLEDEVTC